MSGFKLLFIITAALLAAAGCDYNVDPVKETVLAPPANVSVDLRQDSSSASIAIIKWTASTDEDLNTFLGYKVITYEVSGLNVKGIMFDSINVNKPARSITVSNLAHGAIYKTYIYSLLDNGGFSAALETNAYGGIIAGNSQTIDQYTPSSVSSCAYGWNAAGAGTRCAYDADNAANIDIVCKKDTNRNAYSFYSPASLDNPIAGAKATKFLSLSGDQWDSSNIAEDPVKDNITVAKDALVLIKTQDNYYVKVKITKAAKSGSNDWVTVTFDYKFQNVQGLRAAKR